MALALHVLERPAAAQAALDQALDRASEARLGPGVLQGVAGIAWVAALLGASDAVEEADDVLLGWAAGPAPREHDLARGLAGVGLSALARGRTDVAAAAVAGLARTAEDAGTGVAWRTPPEGLDARRAALAPEGYWEVGVAHGAAGVAAFLAAALRAGIQDAGPLLEAAVSFVLAQEQGGGLPYWVLADRRSEASRLAWCHGELGTALVLLRAAEVAGRPQWRDAGIRLARAAAARDAESAGVEDAGLCHGSAGAAHLFARLARETGDDACAAAARRWRDVTLRMRLPADDPGFLTGAAGVALALRAPGGDWDAPLGY